MSSAVRIIDAEFRVLYTPRQVESAPADLASTWRRAFSAIRLGLNLIELNAARNDRPNARRSVPETDAAASPITLPLNGLLKFGPPCMGMPAAPDPASGRIRWLRPPRAV